MSKSAKHARPLTAATHSFAAPINDFVLSFEYWGVVFWCSVPDSPASETCWLSRWRCLVNISAASVDVSYLATPEARRRSVLVSLWRSQLRSWCGFRGKGVYSNNERGRDPRLHTIRQNTLQKRLTLRPRVTFDPYRGSITMQCTNTLVA